jgi:hypothetical protein
VLLRAHVHVRAVVRLPELVRLPGDQEGVRID